ncbi:MAG: hypothetical protein AAGC65_15985 [Mucilaginibacter sp.]|uniref:hypothetical protein n=1 Tax=Mucilaginibacter sp. TaxID=1882438 RepID=UPI0031A6EA96
MILPPKRIAAILFWIQLIPVTLLVALFSLLYEDDPTSALSRGWDSYLLPLLFLLWIACIPIYFLQFNFSNYLNKRGLWIYPFSVNAIIGSLLLVPAIGAISTGCFLVSLLYWGSALLGYRALKLVNNQRNFRPDNKIS